MFGILERKQIVRDVNGVPIYELIRYPFHYVILK